MKTIFLSLLCLSIAIVFLSCSQSPSDILTEIKNQQKSGNYDNLYEYYTKGTVKALDELDKLSLKNKTGKPKEDKKFADGAEWDVVSEKINGDKAEVKIKYTAHPVENMKGLELTFRMRKEDGKWKIDMERELRMSLDMIKKEEQRIKKK